jgi:hypothetical protein
VARVMEVGCGAPPPGHNVPMGDSVPPNKGTLEQLGLYLGRA